MEDLLDEATKAILGGEVRAAAQQQALLQSPLERPVGRLHVAVLVGFGAVDRVRRSAEVLDEREIAAVEAAPALLITAHFMGGGRRVVCPVLSRHMPQLHQGRLEASAQG